MGVRKLLVFVALLASAGLADAGDHIWSAFTAATGGNVHQSGKSGASAVWNGGLSAGSNDQNTVDRYGWHITGEVVAPGKCLGRHFSFILDVSTQFLKGNFEKSELTQLSVMIGPRWTFRGGRGQPFIHAIPFGFTHSSDSSTGVTNSVGAAALGFGLDVIPAKHGQSGFRLQVDRIVPLARGVAGSWRFSAGYVFKAHEKNEPTHTH